MSEEATKMVDKFASLCNISSPQFVVLDKAGEAYLAIYVGRINNVYTDNLAKLIKDPANTEFQERIFLKTKRPSSWLMSSECQLLQSLLAESLTIGKDSLASPVHRKVAPFVDGKKHQIINDANHVVYGRRGAGKSTLLLHACDRAKENALPFVWIAMQQYQGRDDYQVIPQFLYEMVDTIAMKYNMPPTLLDNLRQQIAKLEDKGDNLSLRTIKIALPVFARSFLPFVHEHGRFYLFIDDIHLLNPKLQPYFLSSIYSFARGNNIFIKLTGIENLTNLYNEADHEGLQTPGDAQVVRLDYNLVNPETAYTHIVSILNGYIKYVGIPSINSMVSDNKVLERLTWTSAGVPRDALYIFNNSVTKALGRKRKKVAVTDINMSAAESMIEKERNLSEDAKQQKGPLGQAIADIKTFCMREIRQNAFLVRIDMDDPKYGLLRKISDLRFIHILHAGITPEKAGEKYEVYLLDYAFYTGFRKAPSVKTVISTPTLPTAKDLRRLPRYKYEDRLDNLPPDS